MTRYVALLRGINVGGKNIVPMAALREAFESAGHDAVRTYIQSGNVVFSSGVPTESIEDDVESMLASRFDLPVRVVVRSSQRFRNVVAKAPAGFGTEPGTYHSDVVFLKAPLTSRRAMRSVELRDGVDRAWPGADVVYFQRLSAQRTKSRMSKLISTPEYQLMTIRNWATTTKLLDLVDTTDA